MLFAAKGAPGMSDAPIPPSAEEDAAAGELLDAPPIPFDEFAKVDPETSEMEELLAGVEEPLALYIICAG